MTTVNGIQVGPNSPAIGLRGCRSEDAEGRQCDDFIARLAGVEGVVQFSQAQAAQQTRGIPDRRYRLLGFTLWYEVKAEDGKLTPSQHKFLTAELQHGELAACGTLEDLQELVHLLNRPADAVMRTALAHCTALVGRWAEKGYRREKPMRRRR
ncbi:MAG: hypothetical protein KF709_02695 [Gemmatimonadaceae bacterium]|nr:hypothetical protein [Gemmatimonadaceae bacterium]